MLKYFNHNKDSLNKSEYLYYSKAIIKFRKHINLKENKKYNNAEIQAMIWTRQRKKAGFKSKAFFQFIEK